MNSSLRYLFVAGLGRRKLGPRDQIDRALRQVLQEIAAATDAQPVALASGAAGADQAFLATAQSLGWTIRLLLPTSPHVFIKDFRSGADDGTGGVDFAGQKAFEQLLDEAVDVEVMPPAPSRMAAFGRAADELIRRADVVVVFWDGEPGGVAGSNESLQLALSLSKPIYLIDTLTGRPRTDFLPVPAPDTIRRTLNERHADGILHELAEAVRRAPNKNGLSAHARLDVAAARHSKGATDPDEATFEEVLEDILKTGARRSSDQHYSHNRIVLGLNLAATTVGLVSLLFLVNTSASHATTVLLDWIELLLVYAAVCMVLWLHYRRHQLRWSRARYVREIGRSLSRTAFVTNHLREPVGAFIPVSIWAIFRRLQQPLLTLYAETRSKRPQLGLQEVMARYRRDTFDPENAASQFRYFQDRNKSTATAKHRLKWAVWTCLGVMVVTEALAHLGIDPATLRILKFASSFLPVLTASLLVLPNLYDWNRRSVVYRSVAGQLKALDARLSALEMMLNDPEATARNEIAGGSLWKPEVLANKFHGATSSANTRTAVEAMVANRFASIVAEAETAILTELIGFKTFVESVELG